MKLSFDLALSEGATGKGEEGERFLRLIWDRTYSLVRSIFPFSDSDFPSSITDCIASASSNTRAVTMAASASL